MRQTGPGPSGAHPARLAHPQYAVTGPVPCRCCLDDAPASFSSSSNQGIPSLMISSLGLSPVRAYPPHCRSRRPTVDWAIIKEGIPDGRLAGPVDRRQRGVAGTATLPLTHQRHSICMKHSIRLETTRHFCISTNVLHVFLRRHAFHMRQCAPSSAYPPLHPAPRTCKLHLHHKNSFKASDIRFSSESLTLELPCQPRFATRGSPCKLRTPFASPGSLSSTPAPSLNPRPFAQVRDSLKLSSRCAHLSAAADIIP